MSYPRHPTEGNPFWDFFASLNNNIGADHPLYAAFNPEARNRGPPPNHDASRPSHHDGPSPPPAQSDEDPPVPPLPGCHQDPFEGHRTGFPFGGGRGHQARGDWGRRQGGRRNNRCGGGPNFHAGGWPNMGGFDMSKLADFIQQFIPDDAAVPRARPNSESTGGIKDFAPEADIFDTEDAYVVHISLPGAKKEDVGVNWDADKSELNVAGVIYRPGDEDFLKTLALDERKVGVFERKVRLGSRQAPAQVESDGISAKMEDGILMITIPKVDKDFVEVKKVDIE